MTGQLPTDYYVYHHIDPRTQEAEKPKNRVMSVKRMISYAK